MWTMNDIDFNQDLWLYRDQLNLSVAIFKQINFNLSACNDLPKQFPFSTYMRRRR